MPALAQPAAEGSKGSRPNPAPADSVIDPAEWQALPLRTEPLVVRQGVHRLSNSLRFRGDGVWLAGPGAVLDLAGNTIYYGEDGGDDRHGVHYYLDWADKDRPPLAGAQEAVGGRVTGGRIVHLGRGRNCHAIAGYRAQDAVIDQVLTLSGGQDTASVFFRWGNAQVLACALVSLTDSTADRHVMPANVEVGAGSRVQGNVILGGNAGVHVAEDSRVVGNFIAQHSFATNGYGAGCYRSQRVVFRDNVIVPLVSGRGIAFNAGSDLVAENNVILAWELPNKEFGWDLNAAGIRVRYEASGCRIQGNTVLAIGGGEHASASALYLTDYAPTNDYRDNRLMAILLPDGVPSAAPPEAAGQATTASGTEPGPTPPPQRTAKCLTFEGQGGPNAEYPATDRLVDNRLRGNHYLVSMSGPDGGCKQLEPVRGLELAWVDGRMARDEFLAAAQEKLVRLKLDQHPLVRQTMAELTARLARLEAAVPHPERRTVYTGYWGPSEELTLLDCRVAEDSLEPVGLDLADLTGQNLRESPRILRIGHTHWLRLVAGGQPVAGVALATVNEADETLRAFADPQGRVGLSVIDYVLEKPPGADLPFRRTPRRELWLDAVGYRRQKLDPGSLESELELVPR